MKKLILTVITFFAAATCAAQAPVGICTPPGGGAVQTIANGYIAPVPFASITMCSAGSTAANCAANKVSIYTTSALNVAALNPFTSDAGGNFFFCVAHGHYAMLQSGSVGSYFISDVVFVDDWANGGTVNGTWTATSFVGPLTGNASTASASDHSPTQCGSGLFATGVTNLWAANCSAPKYQTVDANDTPLPQQPVLNFDGTIVAANGSGQTVVGLPNVGTPGTYAYPSSVTTDAEGRVSSITAGSPPAPTATCTIVTGSRAVNTIYLNSNSGFMQVEATGHAAGSLSGTFGGAVAATSSVVVNLANTTIAGGDSGISFVVPSGYYYEVTSDTLTLNVWTECVVQ